MTLVSPYLGDYNSPRYRVYGSLAQLVEHRAFNPLVWVRTQTTHHSVESRLFSGAVQP